VACPSYGEELTIVVEAHGPHVILRLRGELDQTQTARLREMVDALLAREPRVLVTDLSGLAFLDCAGMAVLAYAHRRQCARGRHLMIYGVQPLVRRVLTLTGMDTYLHLTSEFTPDGPAPG
jgi:anti-sigma B factor antagonist